MRKLVTILLVLFLIQSVSSSMPQANQPNHTLYTICAVTDNQTVDIPKKYENRILRNGTEIGEEFNCSNTDRLEEYSMKGNGETGNSKASIQMIMLISLIIAGSIPILSTLHTYRTIQDKKLSAGLTLAGLLTPVAILLIGGISTGIILGILGYSSAPPTLILLLALTVLGGPAIVGYILYKKLDPTMPREKLVGSFLTNSYIFWITFGFIAVTFQVLLGPAPISTF